MIRHLQNEADVARSSTWRRRRGGQGLATRTARRTSGPVALEGAVLPVSTKAATKDGTSLPPRSHRTPLANEPVQPGIVRLVQRIASGTDPVKDLAIVRAVDGRTGKPTGPKAVMLVGDLATRIAEGSIRLHHGDPHHRRVTRRWEAPLFFGEMRRILIDRISSSRGSVGISPDELVCKMAQAMGVPNNDAANIQFIDAVWISPNATLGARPTARGLTRLRAAFRRRDAVAAPTPPHTAGESAA